MTDESEVLMVTEDGKPVRGKLEYNPATLTGVYVVADDDPWAGLPEYRMARFAWVGAAEIFGKPDDYVAAVLGTLDLPDDRMWIVAGTPWSFASSKIQYLRCSDWELAEWVQS